MTPLMKPRRDTDGDVSSGIFLSSIAGSPRRVGIDRMERDLIPATIIRYASQINGLSSLPDVYECLVPGPAAATRLMIPHAPDLPRRRRYRHRFQAPAGGRRPPHPRRLRPVSGTEGTAAAQLGAAAGRSGVHRRRRPDSCAPRSLRLSPAAGCRRLSRADLL